MDDVAIRFLNVSRKFRRGERHDSIRDLVPTAVRKLWTRNGAEALKDKEFWALRDVSFEVNRGSALGIIGGNGAGKSTALKLLSGILEPTRGTVSISGRLSALIEVGAGFHQDLTGRENILLNGSILGMSRPEIRAKFDQIVEFSELADFIDTPVKRYSSGMYARLGFAVAAHVDPDVLLVDEILSVGDMGFQKKCLERMKQIAKEGTTIVFVSHNLQSVQLLCSHTVWLHQGKIAMSGPTGQVISAYVCGVNGSDESARGIDNIVLCDPMGTPKTVFGPGEPAQLQFEVCSDEFPEGWTLGFCVYRTTDGLAVSEYNLIMPPAHDVPVCRGINVVVNFEVNLMRGPYVIWLRVFDRETRSWRVSLDRSAHFFVEESGSWNGVAHLSPQLRLAKGAP